MAPAFVRSDRETRERDRSLVARRARQAALGLFATALLVDAGWERYVGYQMRVALVRHRLVRRIDHPANSITTVATALLGASRLLRPKLTP